MASSTDPVPMTKPQVQIPKKLESWGLCEIRSWLAKTKAFYQFQEVNGAERIPVCDLVDDVIILSRIPREAKYLGCEWDPSWSHRHIDDGFDTQRQHDWLLDLMAPKPIEEGSSMASPEHEPAPAGEAFKETLLQEITALHSEAPSSLYDLRGNPQRLSREAERQRRLLEVTNQLMRLEVSQEATPVSPAAGISARHPP